MKIVIHCIAPPIPTRKFDYIAYLDGDEGEEDAIHGYGASAGEAVSDLLECLDGNWPEIARATTV